MATLTLATTVEQIAKNYKVDCLYLQTGNFHLRYPLPLIGCRLLVAKAGCPPITMSFCTKRQKTFRKLETESRPLEIYTQYIRSIGFDMEAIRNFSSQEAMRNIIAFYLGMCVGRAQNESQDGPHSTRTTV